MREVNQVTYTNQCVDCEETVCGGPVTSLDNLWYLVSTGSLASPNDVLEEMWWRLLRFA